MVKTTVTCVDLSDIYDYLELSYTEIDGIADRAWTGVSFGDADFTLIGNNFALDCMLEAYESYHKDFIENKTMTPDDFKRKFWEIVGKDDYVNLEY
jgi:hypothetical protein